MYLFHGKASDNDFKMKGILFQQEHKGNTLVIMEEIPPKANPKTQYQIQPKLGNLT